MLVYAGSHARGREFESHLWNVEVQNLRDGQEGDPTIFFHTLMPYGSLAQNPKVAQFFIFNLNDYDIRFIKFNIVENPT